MILCGFLAIAVLGCRPGEEGKPVVAACDRSAASYRTKGKALVGDVDADGKPDRVTLREDKTRPARCRDLLVVQVAGGTSAVATVPPLPWPGTDPRLLLLAEIDGRKGLEPVIAMTSSAAVYRPGRVFTLSQRELLPLLREPAPVPGLFPFDDEFPGGVDCAGHPGTIVVTHGRIADEGDRWFEITRSYYRARGRRFALVREERFQVDAGPEAGRRWPEARGEPFLRCRGRVS